MHLYVTGKNRDSQIAMQLRMDQDKQHRWEPTHHHDDQDPVPDIDAIPLANQMHPLPHRDAAGVRKDPAIDHGRFDR
jgi:hypothetical protein